MRNKLILRRFGAVATMLALSCGVIAAQTVVSRPKNKYTPKQDVELGREAAAEVRSQYPVIEDRAIAQYLSKLGDRLVTAAPPALKDPLFEYSFTPVNVKEINAFALPGGPMFVNRGMIEAAGGEAEVAGVMAHELSHVLLRHGTANASKSQNPWLQLGQIAGIIGGAVVGGAAGSAIAQGSQFGLGTVLMKYSREFEKQADLLGSQIMAGAGYDPRALAHMFETIERESKGGSGPQWLNSHPNPGNRSAYILKEAQQLKIGPAANTSEFAGTRERFASLPPAKSMADVERAAASGGSTPPSVGKPGQPVPRPSAQYKNVGGRGVFSASVPNNWTELAEGEAVKFVPLNGFGPMGDQTVFTHGVEFGVAQASSRDLRQATQAWLDAVAKANPSMRVSGPQQSVQVSQRAALFTRIVNPSPLGGTEEISIRTAFLRDGRLFYYLAVVPEREVGQYRQTFDGIAQSIRFASGM